MTKEEKAARQRARYAADPEKYKARSAAYKAANRDAVKAAGRTYYADNAEGRKSLQARYTTANYDRILARQRAYYDKNAAKVCAYQSAYRKANPDTCKAHQQNRRARILAAGGTHTGQDRVAVFEFYGWRCAWCAEDLLALPPAQRTIDHIVPVSKGGPNDTSNLQPMCARCNSSKKDRLCPT